MSRDGRPVLVDLSLSVPRGTSVAIVGPSGSGKSTLLECLVGVLRPDSGEIRVDGFDVVRSLSRKVAAWRLTLTRCGVVFQFAELLAELTVQENVMLPLLLAGGTGAAAKNQAHDMLDRLGIAQVAESFPAQVSGGERQRAAIARALIHSPALLVADEPTGALDPRTATTAAELLLTAATETGATVIVVTHNRDVARLADRVLLLQAGTLVPFEAEPVP